ncbi:MAG: MFS transporter [Alicyclobacillaceae bacterium]|jgi:DHA1 family multidrug resistance protein-like MFS transporter|uniref:MFS transporter n=1 Tax=Alicyclobacillus sp. SP_1 TaxID=2942475 RepID=UPI002157D9D9|nr:MFS transporter [Alicyclobacillus sp. SP_1]MCY0888071.1 MFS transporter [Alicyclobacillaceae bacterium]
MRQIFRGRSLMALVTLFFCEFVRGALLFYVLPIYIHGVLGLPTIWIGFAIASHYLFDTGLRSPAGWLIDKFGPKRPVGLVLAGGLLGLWLVLHGSHPVWLLSGCALIGSAMAFIWPAVISAVTRHQPSVTHATAMGGVMMAWLAGVGIGAVSMSLVFGHRGIGAFHLLLLVWTLGFVLAVSSLPMDGNHDETHPATLRSVLGEIRSVRMLFPGIFVQTFALGLLLPVFAMYAKYNLGLTGSTYSALLVAGGTATVVLQLPMSRLVDRFGYKRFLVPGFVLSAVSLPILVMLRVVWEVFVGVAGIGAAYAFILPSWNAVLTKSVSERRRASMFGVFLTVEGLGMAIGPLVGTTLWSTVGPLAPFYASSVIFLGMSVFYSVAPLDKLFLH